MAQRSAFFDSVTGDRPYSSSMFAAIVNKLLYNGVVQNFASGMKVVEASPQSLNIQVQLGAIFVNGYYLEVYSTQEQLAIGAAPATGSRIDRIVARLDLTARTLVLAVKAGVSSNAPAPPLLSNTTTLIELSLGRILISAGNTVITTALITDERADYSVCGWSLSSGIFPHATAPILDHPDNSVTDAKIGTRLVNDTVAPINAGIWSSADNTGTVTTLLSRILTHIRYMRSTGNVTHWYDLNTIGLDELVTHAGRHATGGLDAVSPAAIGAVDVTTFNTHASRHAKGGVDLVTPVSIGALNADTGGTVTGEVRSTTDLVGVNMLLSTGIPDPASFNNYGLRLSSSGNIDIMAFGVRVVAPSATGFIPYKMLDERLNAPNVPYFRARRVSATPQLIGAGSNNVIAWNVTEANIGGGSFGSNAYYVPAAGYYEVHAFVVIMQAAGNNNTARLILFVNGAYAETLDFAPFNTAADTGVSGSSVRNYSVNDYIQVVVQPTITNTYIGTSDSKFTVRKVG